MFRTTICTLACLGVLTSGAFGAKAVKKQESELQQALKERFPDAKTEITSTTTESNGVKVYDVKFTTPKGAGTAQVTEYGDFLMFGRAHEYGAVRDAISQDVAGLFTTKPEDIEMYRVTNYYVDFKGPKGKNYTARFDAVGRLKDIANAEQVARESGEAMRGEKISDKGAIDKATKYLKRELPQAQIDTVYQGKQGQGFWVIATKDGGELIVNDQGQVYSMREALQKEDFPEPVLATAKQVFTAPILRMWRGEFEYYQFNQQTQRGQPVVVKMRPNGDIVEVRNVEAQQAEEAQQAKAKQKG